MAFDYKKLLKAYIEHVSKQEGTNFLLSERFEPDDLMTTWGLTKEERDEIVRLSRHT